MKRITKMISDLGHALTTSSIIIIFTFLNLSFMKPCSNKKPCHLRNSCSLKSIRALYECTRNPALSQSISYERILAVSPVVMAVSYITPLDLSSASSLKSSRIFTSCPWHPYFAKVVVPRRNI